MSYLASSLDVNLFGTIFIWWNQFSFKLGYLETNGRGNSTFDRDSFAISNCLLNIYLCSKTIVYFMAVIWLILSIWLLLTQILYDFIVWAVKKKFNRCRYYVYFVSIFVWRVLFTFYKFVQYFPVCFSFNICELGFHSIMMGIYFDFRNLYNLHWRLDLHQPCFSC